MAAEFEEDEVKIQKIHSLILKLFPNKIVEIDCLKEGIKWSVKDE